MALSVRKDQIPERGATTAPSSIEEGVGNVVTSIRFERMAVDQPEDDVECDRGPTAMHVPRVVSSPRWDG